jgi:hypothetical protein
VTKTLEFHDWREVARILNFINRFGCSLESLEVHSTDGLFHTRVTVNGNPEALRRLDAQLTKLTDDDKEMAR